MSATPDLRQQAAQFRAVLVRCVERYREAQGSPISSPFHPPVSRIDFVFRLGDSRSNPYVLLNLDTRPDSKGDGNHTHPQYDLVELPEWGQAVRYLAEGTGDKIPVILTSGKLSKCDAAGLQKLTGDMLVDVLKSARDQHVFKKLPKAKRCELGVEQSGGGYGWPRYDYRGKQHLA